MANPRQETTFKVGEKEYKRRPTFQLVSEIESQFGPLPRILIRMSTGDVGIAQVAALAGVVLGPMRDGGPPPDLLNDAVFDNYTEWLKTLAKFLDGALDAPKVNPPGAAAGQ